MRKLIGTIVILGALIYGAYQLFGASIAANIIQGATGTKTTVKRIHLKLFPFEFGIYGTKIHNLDGFKEPDFVSIPEIFIRVQLLELLKGTLHVEKVTLNLDQVVLERSQAGKVNLKELLDRSKQKQKESTAPKPSEKPSEPSEPAKPQKAVKAQIDEVVVSLGSLSYVDYGTGQRIAKNMDLKIDQEVLRNVTDSYGLTQQVVVLILKKIGLSTLGIQMDIFKGNFEEQAGAMINEAKDKLSKMFN